MNSMLGGKVMAVSSDDRIKFTVPLVPPSVNTYVRHVWRGHHVAHYRTHDADAFMAAVQVLAQGRFLPRGEYGIKLVIYLGRGQRIDIDNAPKCILDAMKGTVIHSDAAVKHLEIDIGRDPKNPRTEIEVWRNPATRKEESIR